jgi:plus agglutinin
MGTATAATYLPQVEAPPVSRSRLTIIISAIIAAFTVMFTSTNAGMSQTIAAISQGGQPGDNIAHAGAFGLFGTADSLGHGMDDYSPWEGSFTNVPVPEKNGRTWTLQEVVGNGLYFVNYGGEGEGDTFTATTNPDRFRDVHYQGLDDEKLKKLRSSGTILMGGFATTGADIMSGVSGIVYAGAHLVTTAAFSPSFVCSDGKDTGCVINIVKIIGGDGHDGGLIGALRDSIFLPFIGLIGFFAIIIAMSRWGFRRIGTRGLIWRIVWTFFIILVLAAFMFAPALVASAPITVAQTVGGCVLGTMTGNGCGSGNGGTHTDRVSGGSTSKANNICQSAVNGSTAKDELALAVNGMMCSVWRTFQLDAYSRGSFGRSFAKMDVEDEKIKKALEKTGLSKDDFCVPLKSSGAAQDYFGKTLELDGGSSHKVCNIVAYQLFLRTDVQSTTDKREKNPVDQRWYKIILLSAHDDQLWTNWTYSIGSSMNRSFSVLTSLLALIPAAVLLIVVSLFAMVYEFLSTFMMIVFPFFGLLALDPDRGRRLFFGWLGTSVSYVAKYIISALILVIVVALFSATLDNVDNPATSNLLVILFTFAAFLYRGQLMDTLGVFRFGGEVMRNRIAEFGQKLQEREGHRIRALAGGAAAGVINSDPTAAIRRGDGFIKNAGNMGAAVFKGAIRGGRYGHHDDMKRNGSDFMKKVYRTSDRLASDNRVEIERGVKSAMGAAESKEREIASLERTQDNSIGEMDGLRRGYESARAKANNAAPNVSAIREHEERIRLDVEVNPIVADYVGAKNELRDVTYARSLAYYQGDNAAVSALDKRHSELSGTLAAMEAEHGQDALQAAEAEYRTDVDNAVAMDGVYLDASTQDAVMDAYRADVTAEKAHHDYKSAVDRYNERAADLEKLRPEAAGERARANALQDARNAMPMGKNFKTEERNRIMDNADKVAGEVREDTVVSERRMDDLLYESSVLAKTVPAVSYATQASQDSNTGNGGDDGDVPPTSPPAPHDPTPPTNNNGGGGGATVPSPKASGDSVPTKPTPVAPQPERPQQVPQDAYPTGGNDKPRTNQQPSVAPQREIVKETTTAPVPPAQKPVAPEAVKPVPQAPAAPPKQTPPAPKPAPVEDTPLRVNPVPEEPRVMLGEDKPAPNIKGTVFEFTPEQDEGIKSTLDRMRRRANPGNENRFQEPEQYPDDPPF